MSKSVDLYEKNIPKCINGNNFGLINQVRMYKRFFSQQDPRSCCHMDVWCLSLPCDTVSRSVCVTFLLAAWALSPPSAPACPNAYRWRGGPPLAYQWHVRLGH